MTFWGWLWLILGSFQVVAFVRAPSTGRRYLHGALAALFVVIAFAVGTGHGQSSSPNASSATIAQDATATDAPEATPNNHDAREAAQQYWNPVLNELGIAGAAVAYAGKAEQGGDAVSAEQILARAGEAADAAYNAAMNNAPSGDTWTAVQSDLMDASSKYKTAIQEFRDGLGTGDSEKMANALDDAQAARSSLDDATGSARDWYVQNGGQRDDLEDYSEAETSAEKLLHILSQ